MKGLQENPTGIGHYALRQENPTGIGHYALRRPHALTRSRQSPTGDKRLTTNIRADVHKKLKMAAVERETTIGELVEELISKHLKSRK